MNSQPQLNGHLKSLIIINNSLSRISKTGAPYDYYDGICENVYKLSSVLSPGICIPSIEVSFILLPYFHMWPQRFSTFNEIDKHYPIAGRIEYVKAHKGYNFWSGENGEKRFNLCGFLISEISKDLNQ